MVRDRGESHTLPRGAGEEKVAMSDKNSRQLKAFHAALVTASPDDLEPDVMQGWIDNPASLARAVRVALAPNMDGAAAWSVWRTITIGGVSKGDLASRLKDGFFVSDWARDIMGNKRAFTTLPESTGIALVQVKVADLGFTKEPTTTELYQRARERGLNLCPAEVGPHLRLADADQKRGTWYRVAMEPISGSDGVPLVFDVGRHEDGHRWLDTGYADPGDRWNLDLTIVFSVPVRK